MIQISVSIMRWCVEIGIFNTTRKIKFPFITSKTVNYLLLFYILIILFVSIILFVCGDFEPNQTPKKCNSCKSLLNCHWNLNGIASQNFEKVCVLEVCNRVNKFDFICLSESCLYSSISSDNKILRLTKRMPCF